MLRGAIVLLNPAVYLQLPTCSLSAGGQAAGLRWIISVLSSGEERKWRWAAEQWWGEAMAHLYCNILGVLYFVVTCCAQGLPSWREWLLNGIVDMVKPYETGAQIRGLCHLPV